MMTHQIKTRTTIRRERAIVSVRTAGVIIARTAAGVIIAMRELWCELGAAWVGGLGRADD